MGRRRALVLASGSPRRRALLREAGFRFRVAVPGVDETVPAGWGASRAALEVARRKARAVARRMPPRAHVLVLAADTVVALGRRLLGKAADADEARAILAALSGTSHRVVTGVCAIALPERRATAFAVTTRVAMRRWTRAEREAYVRSGEWKGKAGAYAIQETADRFVTRIDGSLTNVVGLPMERVARLLAEGGTPARPPARTVSRPRARSRGTRRGPAAGRGAPRRRSRRRGSRPRSAGRSAAREDPSPRGGSGAGSAPSPRRRSRP